MSNLAINSKNSMLNTSSSVKAPPKNGADNQANDFRVAFQQLQEKASVYNPKNIQPTTSLRTDSIEAKEKFVIEVAGLDPIVSEGTTITRIGGTKIPEPVPMSPEELATWQKNLADLAKSEKEITEQMSPEGQKKYLMSKQVDVVARDKEGNIVAKMYKDGSWMCSNDLANNLAKCNSNAERIGLLEKNSNVMVSDYTKEKVTDFDLLKEEFAQIEKRLAIHPELRAEIVNSFV